MKINSKAKGSFWENRFWHWLRENDIDKTAGRTIMSGGGTDKGDISNSLGINFECKAVKKLSLRKTMLQSERDAQQSRTTPYAVIHFDGMEENRWYIVLDNYDWADLFKKSREPKIVQTSQSMNQKWIVKNAITALKKVLQLLEGKV